MGRAEMQRAIESRVRTAYDTIKLDDEMTARIDKEEDIKVIMNSVLEELHPKFYINRTRDKAEHWSTLLNYNSFDK